MPDKTLLSEAKNGSKEALLQLYQQNRRLIYKYVSRYESIRYSIDDLMQEAYFAMIKAVEAYELDSGHAFTTYLFNSLKWYFSHYLRSDKNRHDCCILDAPSSTSEEDGATRGELIEDETAAFEDEVLHRATIEKTFDIAKKTLSETNEPCFDVLYWRYGNNVSHVKIAETLGCSLQEVKKIEKKALQILRKKKAIYAMCNSIIDASCHHGTLAEFRYTNTSSVEWAAQRLTN